ncbi:unnamed protein product [Closterium sp. Naga37s-1]|nr:unnamed protein product [Closterium sp. Naga37s-1]
MAVAFSTAMCGAPSASPCYRSSFLPGFNPSSTRSFPQAIFTLNSPHSHPHLSRIPPCAAAATRGAGKAGSGEAARMVMVLGKGGSGKTTASVLLAQRYAAEGYRTCLVVQSQDRVADRLLGMRLTPSPQPMPAPAAAGGDAAAAASQQPLLCALRVETTKLLLAPLEIIKKADERLGITQGALAEVVGEELSVLPGMDAVMAVAVLERIARPAGGLLAFATSSGPRSTSAGKKGAAAGEWVYPWGEEEAEVVVFDGPTTWEVLRMLAGPEKARWYLRRFRALAERTDIGRVALPSVARLLDSIVGSSKGGSGGSGGAGGGGVDEQRSTAEIWEKLDSFLSKAVSSFADPYRTSVFLLADAASHSSVDTCRRIWGCAVQAGVSPSGVFLLPSEAASATASGGLAEKFSPLPVAQLPVVSEEAPAAVAAAAGQMNDGAVAVMNGEGAGKAPPAVDVDVAACTVRLFLPGFDKQEVKLQQGSMCFFLSHDIPAHCLFFPFLLPSLLFSPRSPPSPNNHQRKGEAELLVEAVEGRGRAAGGGGGPEAVCGAASSHSGEAAAARNPAAALSSTLSGLQSSLSGQIASLDALLKTSLENISAALKSRPSAADNALQAQISALKANLAAFNESLVNLNALNISGSDLNVTDLISSKISGIRSNISSITTGIAALNKDLAWIIGSGVSSGVGSGAGMAGALRPAAGAASASGSAAIRAAVRQRLAAVTQRVAGLNGNVSALAGMVTDLHSALSSALDGALNSAVNGGALNGALNGDLNGALNGGLNNGGVVGDLANLLPQQAGMLRAVLTSCNGLLSLQAGAADIQVLKIGSDYMLTYYLYVAGVTKAPDSQAIFKDNACSNSAASAALALPGTWVPMSPVSWSLANVVRASAADVADVLASIQEITNDDLFLGFSGADVALSGRMMGGRV